jgi:hypothetical protein
MNNSTQDKSLLTISYVLFIVVLAVLGSCLAIPSTGKYSPSLVPFGFTLTVAVIWQGITLYHHRGRLIAWTFMLLYISTLIGMLIYALRSVA